MQNKESLDCKLTILNQKKQKETKQINSFENLLTESLIQKGQAVYLNIYHLTKINYLTQVLLGIGFFHSTIEVNNTEYYFGRTTLSVSGIFSNKFGESPYNLILKEKIYLGTTIFNDNTILNLLISIVPQWLGKSYDPFIKNCNHFTYYLARRLLRCEEVRNYPEYLNRITEFALFLTGFYSPLKRIYQNSFEEEEDKENKINNRVQKNNEFNVVCSSNLKAENQAINDNFYFSQSNLNGENDNIINTSNQLNNFSNSFPLESDKKCEKHEEGDEKANILSKKSLLLGNLLRKNQSLNLDININDITELSMKELKSNLSAEYNGNEDLNDSILIQKLNNYFFNFVIHKNYFIKIYKYVLETSTTCLTNNISKINNIAENKSLIKLNSSIKIDSIQCKYNINKIESFMTRLAYADHLLYVNLMHKEALKNYQLILIDLDILNETEINIISENIYNYLNNEKNNDSIYKEPNLFYYNNKLVYIKLKILFSILYIYYKTNHINNLESICNKILNINNKDNFATFFLAYCRYKDNNFPECNSILQQALMENKDNEAFTQIFRKFLSILNNTN